MAAETEAIGDGFFDADFPGCIGDVVEIAAAFDVRLFEIDGGMEQAVAEAQDGCDSFDTAASAEQMADHAFGAGDHQLAGMWSED